MDDLATWILARLDADAALTPDEQLLILAAFEGDDALADLGGFTPPTPAPTSSDEKPEPAGAFLKQLKVRGFRGIGPEAQLDFVPGPGLTVVSGRNGSGKSSFAEALEFALTRRTYRWRDRGNRSVTWTGNWRNLHSSGPSGIDVVLCEEGVGQTRVNVEWSDGAGLDEASVFTQRHSKPRESGTSCLGWDGPLETYRPLLTYEELGSLLASEPSKLYDEVARVLGLEQLADAIKRLEDYAKRLGAPEKDAALRRRGVTEALTALDDERAAQAVALLKKRTVDIGALRAVATGTDTSTSKASAALKQLLDLRLPSVEDVLTAASRLREAVEAAATAGDAASRALELRTEVREAALALHGHSGEEPCPVCGVGQLDAAWAESATAEVAHAREQLAGLSRATAALREARRAAAELVAPVPLALRGVFDDELVAREASSVLDAWSAWASIPESDLDRVAHLNEAYPRVAERLTMLLDVATEVLATRDEAWTPVATQLGAYLDAAERWEAVKNEAIAAGRAAKWLKENDAQLKNDRLAPIAEQAREIWSHLRQESNVELSGLKLEGSNTRRHVVIEASVDDASVATGLTVLSQGELHALALALFLPRATLPESPFRFVVLDDPVQAMDPAKVDGFVRVLAKIAEHRQVIVFSHDNRLAAAVRRAEVNAQILEVTRESQSRVSVAKAFNPPQRYLCDAHAMLKDERMPEDATRKVLPGMLRFAVEAQARDRFFADALGSGRAYVDVELQWEATKSTSQRVALALYGEQRDLKAWLDKRPGRHLALGVCTSGVHEPLRGDPLAAHDAVSRMVADIEARVR